MVSDIEKNYKQVLLRFKNACQHSAREEESIELLAVSKKQSIEKIKKLYSLGHRVFAESYLQELALKHKELGNYDIKWVYIGRVQSNKLDKIISYVDELQSLSKLSHAQKLNTIVEKKGLEEKFKVYILVNAGAEPSKDGVLISEVFDFYQQLINNETS